MSFINAYNFGAGMLYGYNIGGRGGAQVNANPVARMAGRIASFGSLYSGYSYPGFGHYNLGGRPVSSFFSYGMGGSGGGGVPGFSFGWWNGPHGFNMFMGYGPQGNNSQAGNQYGYNPGADYDPNYYGSLTKRNAANNQTAKSSEVSEVAEEAEDVSPVEDAVEPSGVDEVVEKAEEAGDVDEVVESAAADKAGDKDTKPVEETKTEKAENIEKPKSSEDKKTAKADINEDASKAGDGAVSPVEPKAAVKAGEKPVIQELSPDEAEGGKAIKMLGENKYLFDDPQKVETAAFKKLDSTNNQDDSPKVQELIDYLRNKYNGRLEKHWDELKEKGAEGEIDLNNFHEEKISLAGAKVKLDELYKEQSAEKNSQPKTAPVPVPTPVPATGSDSGEGKDLSANIEKVKSVKAGYDKYIKRDIKGIYDLSNVLARNYPLSQLKANLDIFITNFKETKNPKALKALRKKVNALGKRIAIIEKKLPATDIELPEPDGKAGWRKILKNLHADLETIKAATEGTGKKIETAIASFVEEKDQPKKAAEAKKAYFQELRKYGGEKGLAGSDADKKILDKFIDKLYEDGVEISAAKEEFANVSLIKEFANILRVKNKRINEITKKIDKSSNSAELVPLLNEAKDMIPTLQSARGKLPDDGSSLPPKITGKDGEIHDWSVKLSKCNKAYHYVMKKLEKISKTAEAKIADSAKKAAEAKKHSEEPRKSEDVAESLPSAKKAGYKQVSIGGKEYNIAQVSGVTLELVGDIYDNLLSGTLLPEAASLINLNGDNKITEDEMVKYKMLHGGGIEIMGFKSDLRLDSSYRENLLTKIDELKAKHGGVTFDDLKVLSDPGSYSNEEVQVHIHMVPHAKAFTKDLFKWIGGKDGFGIWVKYGEEVGWDDSFQEEYGDINDVIAGKKGACTEKTAVILSSFKTAGIKSFATTVYDRPPGVIVSSKALDGHICAAVEWADDSARSYYDGNNTKGFPVYKSTKPLSFKEFYAELLLNKATQVSAGSKMKYDISKKTYGEGSGHKEAREMLVKAAELSPESDLINMNLAKKCTDLSRVASKVKRKGDALEFSKQAIDHYLKVAEVIEYGKPKGAKSIHKLSQAGEMKELLKEEIVRYVSLSGKKDVDKLAEMAVEVVKSCGPRSPLLMPIIKFLKKCKATKALKEVKDVTLTNIDQFINFYKGKFGVGYQREEKNWLRRKKVFSRLLSG